LKQSKLKIGRFSYSNLFPIFYMLEKECNCSGYEFIEGVPSGLNRMLRNGDIDVSPSSSIEYLRYSGKYSLLEGHSISSAGPVISVLLFTKRPLEALNGLTVLVSSQSETSVALLEIIFKKFIGIKCNLKQADLSIPVSDAQLKGSDAYLLIGDDALKVHKSPFSSALGRIHRGEKGKRRGITEAVHIYDLGELWFKYTELPFTFALWIHRKECCPEKAELLERFRDDLDRAKELAKDNLKIIANASPLKNILSEDELIAYWGKISYDFSGEHKKGLELFAKFSKELGLL